jgi:hypothetical protein
VRSKFARDVSSPARLAGALVLIAALSSSACAPMCQEMAADRKAFFGHRATSASPHATIFVPFDLANRLMSKRLGEVQPIGSPISLPGKVGELIGSVRLFPRRLVLRPAPDDRLGLRMDIEVLQREKPLFTVTLDVEARPEVDASKGLLEVGLRADDLKSVTATLGPDATDALAAVLRARLPSVASSVLSQDQVAAIVKSGTDLLAERLGGLLIPSGLLAPLGELTRLGVEIPIVPVSRLTFRSVGDEKGGLLVGVFTALPVGAGVSLTDAWLESTGALRLRLSGDALAQLGNWALVTGRLPRRYDKKMRPKEDGELTPGLRWASGPRPLQIFAWRVKKPCLRARIGSSPLVSLAEGRLVVGIDEGVVEEVRGAALVRARVWTQRIGADAIRFSKKVVSSARVSIAGIPVDGAITDAFYRDGEFGIELIAD